MFELQKYLIFLLMVWPFMVVHSGSSKDPAGLQADLSDFKQQAVENSRQIRWVEDFESNLAKPSPFNRSRLFRRDHRKAASGHFSLVLQIPSRGIETGRLAGGDIVKVALPKTIHDYYSISIKTHLEELGRGRVILRASFFKLVSRPGSTGKEGIRLRTIELGNIESIEDDWTKHQYKRSLRSDIEGWADDSKMAHKYKRSLQSDSLDADYMMIYAALDSGDDASGAAGLIYLDDVIVSFFSPKNEAGQRMEDFESETSALSPVSRSDVFTRTRQTARSGNHSLLLKIPQEKYPDHLMLGGDITRISIPDGRALCTVSMETWLKELDSGRLMLRASFYDEQGGKMTETVLDDLVFPEDDWTSHTFEIPLHGSDVEMDSLSIWVGLTSVAESNVSGQVYLDDIKFEFSGERQDPNQYRLDFERPSGVPPHIRHSRTLSLTGDEAASGYVSLLLESPLADGSSFPMIGEDLVRLKVPKDKAHFRISMKTWLKELVAGRLMLRASLYDRNEDKMGIIRLDDLTSTETAWTQHEYKGLLNMADIAPAAIHVYAALDSMTSRTVSGIFYMDDFELDFYGDKTGPDLFRMSFDPPFQLPGYLENSVFFSLMEDGTGPTDTSLLLKAPVDGRSENILAGGDIARVEVPPDMGLVKISLKTCLKELKEGRLMLRTVFMDRDGNKIKTRRSVDIVAPGNDWTEQRFAYSLRDLDVVPAQVRLFAALDSQSSRPAQGIVGFDDLNISFHAWRNNSSRLKLDYETRSLLPPHFETSSNIHQTDEESVSGDYSVLIQSPRPDGLAYPVVGEDLVKIAVPAAKEGFRVSIKTWLKELDAGRLMLRTTFWDTEGEKIISLVLEDVMEPEDGWVDHTYEGQLPDDTDHVRTLSVYAALDSQSGNPVNGRVYIDDVDIQYTGGDTGYLDKYRLDFEYPTILPRFLERSRVFSRTPDAISPGGFCLRISSSTAGNKAGRSIGGLITRVDLPEGTLSCKIALKTRIVRLESGVLFLRVGYLDKHGTKVADHVLEKITKIRKDWTDHRFTHWLPFLQTKQGEALDEVARTLVLSVHLDSQTVKNVNGDAYIDDIDIEFN